MTVWEDTPSTNTLVTAARLNDLEARGDRGLVERSLAADPAAGAASITLNQALPAGIGTRQGFLVIDPFTVQAEVRRVVSGTTTVTLDTVLAYDHDLGDNVLVVVGDPRQHVAWWGAKGDGSNDDTTNLQAAFAATLPTGLGRHVVLMSSHKVTGTIYVGSETRIEGRGPLYNGTTIINTTNAIVFDYRVTASSGAAKNATDIEMDHVQFYKGSANLNTTAYCIDATGADMCSWDWITFGKHAFGCMNGIHMASSGVMWINHVKAIYVGFVSGVTPSTAGTSGDDAAIKVSATSDAININDIQCESASKILLTNVRGLTIRGYHGEYTNLELHNTCFCTFRDMTWAAGTIRLDNKSNDNLFDNVAGANMHVADYGSNTWQRVDGPNNVGRLTRDFGPFNHEHSPLKPTVIATTYSTTPPIAYGNPGDVILFAVKAVSNLHATTSTDTIRFKSTADASTLHTSPSIALAQLFAAVEQTASRSEETFTYWHMETVPAGGQIYLESSHRLSVWAAKVLNPNPFLDSLVDWSTGGATAGNFSAATTCTPSMSSTQYRVDWTSGQAWAIQQFTKPVVWPPRLLMVLRGRWASNQRMALTDNIASSGGDRAQMRDNWKSGDEAFNLQTTDKLMFAVVQPGVATTQAGLIYQQFSFGGYAVNFDVNTQVEIDWAAMVALDA